MRKSPLTAALVRTLVGANAAKAQKPAAVAASVPFSFVHSSSNSSSSNSSSTSQEVAPEVSRDYLRTWLGKDMAGERYLSQMVNAATQKHEQEKARERQMASMLQSAHAGVSHQYFSVPVLSIKWGSSPLATLLNDVQAVTEALARGDAVFLDMAGVSSSTNAHAVSAQDVAAVVKALQEGSKALHVLGAVNCLDEKATTISREANLHVAPLSSRGGAPPAHKKVNTPAPAPSSSQPKQQQQQQQQPAPAASPTSMIHIGAVRSGQQLYAEGTSLVVSGSVNNGADVWADGDIHVYGHLKGRAVAGLGGSQTARVFAHQFDASLVGIADAFAMPDDFGSLSALLNKSVCVRLVSGDKASSSEVQREVAEGGTLIECGNGKKLLLSLLPTH